MYKMSDQISPPTSGAKEGGVSMYVSAAVPGGYTI